MLQGVKGSLNLQVAPSTGSALDSWKPGSEEEPGDRKEQRSVWVWAPWVWEQRRSSTLQNEPHPC